MKTKPTVIEKIKQTKPKCSSCKTEIVATLDNGKTILCYDTKCKLYGKEQKIK